MRERIWVKKAQVQQTCWASPSQWEGETVEGISLYIRYRWGWLSVQSPFDSYDGNTLLGKRCGDDLDGSMDSYEMYEQTASVIKWID